MRSPDTGGEQRLRLFGVPDQAPLVVTKWLLHPGGAGIRIDEDHVVFLGELARQLRAVNAGATNDHVPGQEMTNHRSPNPAASDREKRSGNE